jgi:hypothetical protein
MSILTIAAGLPSTAQAMADEASRLAALSKVLGRTRSDRAKLIRAFDKAVARFDAGAEGSPEQVQALAQLVEIKANKPDLAELFVTEFKREMARLARDDKRRADNGEARLAELDAQIETLAQNMTLSIASPTLHRMLTELEQERSTLQARQQPKQAVGADILPHPTLLKLFEEKVASLREALNDEAVATQAASTLSSLIESVTIYPGAEPEAEVAANVVRLIAFAANENSPRAGRHGGCSTMVVAGVGFEPTTFRL